jgi:ribosome-associated protein
MVRTINLAKKIANKALEKKALDIKIFDLRKLTTVTDFFVIATGGSDTHVKAIANHVEEEMEKNGVRLWHKEGYKSLKWVLLDYVDVVVHIFQREAREFYGMERLWGDAKITEIKDKPTTIISKKKPPTKTKTKK